MKRLIFVIFTLLLVSGISYGQGQIVRKPTSTHATGGKGNKGGKANQGSQGNSRGNRGGGSQGSKVNYGGGNVETFTVNGVSFDMVRVDGGSFMMGSYEGDSDEKPVHNESVGTFYIGKTEVTQRLWKAVMDSNPSYFTGGDNLPVEYVSWDDCQNFILKLNELTGKQFRLPSEVEWEYAARGGNKSQNYLYSGSNNINDVAWYDGNSGQKTHVVAEKQPNELGIYDMSGNVWEWTSDIYSENYSSPRNSAYRVNRGGGWLRSAALCRVAFRSNGAPGDRGGCLGLRLAL